MSDCSCELRASARTLRIFCVSESLLPVRSLRKYEIWSRSTIQQAGKSHPVFSETHPGNQTQLGKSPGFLGKIEGLETGQKYSVHCAKLMSRAQMCSSSADHSQNNGVCNHVFLIP